MSVIRSGPDVEGGPLMAYLDRPFLESDPARPIRILAEYLRPYHVFEQHRVRDTIVFFGSARLHPEGPLGRYYTDARELGRLVTEWSQKLDAPNSCYLVCTGGGPGIMEAANRGAVEAGGRTIGLNIGLPHEQRPNPFVTPELLFQFHYFFMRKLWFAYLARAMVFFPGGFGTLDELFEILTLSQTNKLSRKVPILLYGSSYWNELVDFEMLVRDGMIARDDLGLFRFVDRPDEALEILQREITPEPASEAPALAASETPEGRHDGRTRHAPA